MSDNKRVVSPGKGEPPNFVDGAKAIFHYRVDRLKTGEEGEAEAIDDSRQGWPRGYGQPMEIIYGKQFKLPVWESCLRSMRTDEVAEFVLETKDLLDYPFVSKQLRDLAKQRHSHGHGEHEGGGVSCGHSCMGLLSRTGLGYPELDDWLRRPEPLRFTFHLLRVQQPDEYEESWALSPEQKLDSIPSLKAAGNDLFRLGRLDEAETKYSEALSRLESLLLREKPGEPEWTALDVQKVPLYLNLAQIKLTQREYYAAIEAAGEVLKREPRNSKALFRRAKASIGAWNLDDARRDLENLRRFDSTCSNIAEKELQRINELSKRNKSEEAARFRNIFQ